MTKKINYILSLLLILITQLSLAQTVSTYAGTGSAGFSGDGYKAIDAQLNQPYGIAVDDNGVVYFADQLNKRIRKIDENGIISTLIDTTDILGFTPSNLEFYNNALYFLNVSSNTITNLIKYDLLTHTHSVIQPLSTSTNVHYNNLAIKGDSVFLVKNIGSTVYSIDLLYNIGVNPILFSDFSSSSSNQYNYTSYNFINDLEIDINGNLLVLSVNGNGTASKIVKLNLTTAIISTKQLTNLNFPEGMTEDTDGNIYLANRGTNENQIYKVSATTGSVIDYAGQGTYGFLNGALTDAKFKSPTKIAYNNEIIYVVDTDDNRIRRIGCTVAPAPILQASVGNNLYCKTIDNFTISIGDPTNINDNLYWVWHKETCDGPILDTTNTFKVDGITQSTTYAVRAEGGCSQNGLCKTITINVIDCGNDTIKTKNSFSAFTPNGDGVNDFFIFSNITSNTTVYIYNKWGDLLKRIENYDNINNVWDGTGVQNQKLPPGTYFYTTEINNTKGASGWVQLLR